MKKNTSIWIIEDDPSCRFVYEQSLDIKYQLRFFGTLKQLTETNYEDSLSLPNLLLADVRLPDGSFLTFMQSEGFDRFKNVPLMVISSIDDLDALRFCYQQGASDYMTKPFAKNELLIRIERVLENFQTESLVLNPTFLSATRQGKSSRLTSKEFQILSLLKQAPNRKLKREDITRDIWGDMLVGDRTLNVHLANLRRKLEPLAIKIHFCPPDSYILEYL